MQPFTFFTWNFVGISYLAHYISPLFEYHKHTTRSSVKYWHNQIRANPRSWYNLNFHLLVSNFLSTYGSIVVKQTHAIKRMGPPKKVNGNKYLHGTKCFGGTDSRQSLSQKHSPPFMELEGPLSCSQEAANGPYPGQMNPIRPSTHFVRSIWIILPFRLICKVNKLLVLLFLTIPIILHVHSFSMCVYLFLNFLSVSSLPLSLSFFLLQLPCNAFHLPKTSEARLTTERQDYLSFSTR